MDDRISAFGGKVIAIEMLETNRVFYMLPLAKNEENIRVRLVSDYSGKPDTTISGTPLALFKMGLTSDVAPLMLSGEISIEGDVRLGKEFKLMFVEMDVDWEEQLSCFIGDVLAHQSMKVSKQLLDWTLKLKQSVMSNVSEYLQEESRDVVSGEELEVFYQHVDVIRDRFDKLQTRANNLKRP